MLHLFTALLALSLAFHHALATSPSSTPIPSTTNPYLLLLVPMGMSHLGAKKAKRAQSPQVECGSVPITSYMDTLTREKVEARILEKLSTHEELNDDQKRFVVSHPRLLCASTGNAISDQDPEFSNFSLHK